MESVAVREARIIRELRDVTFKDHRAELIECGEGVTILQWKVPDTWQGHIRYVFDSKNLYISGSKGETVLKFPEKVGVHSFKDMSCTNFFRQMYAYSDGKYEFDSGVAAWQLMEWKEEEIEFMQEDEVDEDEIEEFEEYMDEMISETNSVFYWGFEYCEEEYKEFLMENGKEEESISNIGKVIPRNHYAFLVGLIMASKQLREE